MSTEVDRMERQIAGFEKAWDCDVAYMRDLLAAGPDIFTKFQGMMSIVDARAASRDALFAAQTLAVLDGDCEPCVQLGVDMSRSAGVSDDLIKAVLTGDEAGMNDDARLGFCFARASLTRDLSDLEDQRAQVEARWSRNGLAALSLAIVVGRMYPALKHALGYGRVCRSVSIGAEMVTVRRDAVLGGRA